MQLTASTAPTTIASQQTKNKEGIGKSTMDRQDFLNLLVTQLQNQDPLNPTDNAEFLSQTTAFSQLDEMQTMSNALTTMLEMMQKQNSSASDMFNATNFIGKEVEFATNTVTVGDGPVSNISFYLTDTPMANKTQINVYNEKGELAAIIRPNADEVKKGSNTIAWDGFGVGGVEVADGLYSFEVISYNANNEKLPVDTFGKATVKGVKEVNGTVYFDIGNGSVAADYIYAVSNPEEEVKD